MINYYKNLLNYFHYISPYCRPEDGPEPHYQGVAKGYERLHLTESFYCELGGILPEITLAYETYGNLSEDKSNAILLHAGLSASSHAKSHEVSNLMDTSHSVNECLT